MPLLLILLTGNFLILIICLMGVQACYFKARWRWFWLMLVCVLISAGCIAVEICAYVYPPAREILPLQRPPPMPL